MRDEPTLAAAIAAGEVLHLSANITHARRGAVRDAFSYGADYVVLGASAAPDGWLFRRNRFAFASVHDRDHGGPRGSGTGFAWARKVFAGAGLDLGRVEIALLTQPRVLGVWFTPVSFWLALRGSRLLGVIAEVNNTFGDRHSYLLHHPGFDPIRPEDQLTTQKVFHVSPFQDVAGTYNFRFDVGRTSIAVQILHKNGDEGLAATVTGEMQPIDRARFLASVARRPGGAIRVLALIYWRALRLKFGRARYRRRPPPPDTEVT